MTKKRLSKNQQRHVNINHHRKQQWSRIDSHLDTTKSRYFLPARTGLIVSCYGRSADVEDEAGYLYRCHIRRTIPSVVTGDRVVWCPGIAAESTGIIEAVLDRYSQFMRPDYYDGLKPIAANIDQISIVSATLPSLSFSIIDRYLVACETLQIRPMLVINKLDLLNQEQKIALIDSFAGYQQMGYRVLWVSQKTGEGVDALRQQLIGHTSVFVGQSGVGKSSLINSLGPPEASRAVKGSISARSGLGQHTTTASRLYHLPSGGDIIDSPGVREFGLWHLSATEVVQGFIEFRPYLGQCRYRDCKHDDDPDCALQQGVQSGQILGSRLASYHYIITTMTASKAKKHRAYKKGKAKK